MLTVDEQAELLELARRALRARVLGETSPALDRLDGGLAAPCGAFVSLHRGDELRGCLGRLTPDWPLARVVAHLAAIVADSDPRFGPVGPDELDELDIEISVLTPEREIASIDEIDIGRHGVVVERGRARGVLLPQVAVEHGWDAQAFVEQACLKAGLPADGWRRGARVYVFEAAVFNERTLAGLA
ncbi:MAG TPA: AmmeMemoRadiSam system protein A [Vicinamibacterales bacterium]|nr:AmmeMemoRadiSam system protein A [Vicinamibacterales bacterium]